MTEHPLTDELLQQIGCANPRARVFDTQAMRAAYDKGRDDQLEQVIEWLNETIFERGRSLEAVNIPEELREAMRPTTTQENNLEMTEPLYRVYEQQEVGGRYYDGLTFAQAKELFSNMVEAGHAPVMEEIPWRTTDETS